MNCPFLLRHKGVIHILILFLTVFAPTHHHFPYNGFGNRMFHYTEKEGSTGEPPTPPSETLVRESISGSVEKSTEPDSGYEASPSSTNEHCTFSFDKSSVDVTEHSETEEEMHRADSGSSSTAVSEEDLAHSPEPRPSSLPIPIPGARFATSERHASRRPANSNLTSHPLSWPSAWPLCRPAPRCRHRLIDSDASLTSSEEDEPEEVFVEGISSQALSNGGVTSSGRVRSFSVNLPLEPDLAEAVVAVGRSLRHLSDQFNAQIRLRRRSHHQQRRRTLDSISRNGQHPLDYSDDSEDDPLFSGDRSS